MSRRIGVIALLAALVSLILAVAPTATAGAPGLPVIGPDTKPAAGPDARLARVPPGYTTAKVRGRAAIPFSLIPTSRPHQRSAAAAVPAVAAGGFVSMPPRRLLDTRSGLGAARTAVGADRSVTLQVAGSGGIPRSGVAAVVLNVTATGGTGPGFITVYPSGGSRPIASNLNYEARSTVANLVVAPVGANGKVVLYNGSGTPIQLIADLSGYYGAVDEVSSPTPVIGGFLPVGPVRMLDTRIGDGAPRAAVAAGSNLPLQVLGRYGIPRTGISAVVVNLTVTGANRPGYVTAYANGLPAPHASNLNFAARRTVATLAVVPVGADGRIRLRNGSSGAVSLVVDVAGYIRTGMANVAGSYTPLNPTRVLDTRVGIGARRAAIIGPRTFAVQVAGRAGVPSAGVAAVAITLTVTAPTGIGYLTAFAGRAGRPRASNLNFTAGRTVSNMVVVPVGRDGRIQVFNGSAASVQVVADVAGYFLTGARASLTWSPSTSLEQVHGHPLAISCPTSSFCMAGDASGSVLRFDGRAWSEPVLVDPGHTFVAMSCTSMSFCIAADLDGRVVSYNGRTWTRPRTIDPVGLAATSCASRSFCVAIGLSGQVIRFDGSTWRAGDVDALGQLTAVSCVSATFCQAVDLSGRAFRWNGTRWSAPVLTDPGQPSDELGVGMWAISCASATWCVAVEDTGRAVTFDGSWQTPTTLGRGAAMYQVTCAAPRFCAATDVNGGVLTSNGGAWTTSSVALTGTGSGSPVVSCASAVFCTAVDTDGNGSTWNGTAWAAAGVVELNNMPSSISCPTNTFCQAVDAAGRVFSYRGARWSGPTTIDPGGRLSSVSCPSVTFCAAVDLEGQAILFDGRAWSAPATALTLAGTGDDMVSVSCTSRTFCAAVTSSGRAVTYNGATWSGAGVLGRSDTVASVSCAGTLCIAVDFDGHAYRFQGRARFAGVSVEPGPLLAVSCVGHGSFCATVGLFGDVVTFDGSRWGPPRVVDDLSNGLAGVSCVSATFCTAVDLAGNASNFDGFAWSPPTAIPGAGSATSVSCASRSFCAVIDSTGGVAMGRGRG